MTGENKFPDFLFLCKVIILFPSKVYTDIYLYQVIMNNTINDLGDNYVSHAL